jgi:hypothetical protein
LFVGPLWRRRIDAFKRMRTNGELSYEDPFEGQYKVDTGDCIDKIQYVSSPSIPINYLPMLFIT